MDIKSENLKKQIREEIKLGHIAPEDIPSIELYMDQVTTFMDKYLSQNKRFEEDKTLTKTMINNYSKNNLLPPSDKKRYSKEHIILLIYIYYLKNVVSINDIQTTLGPLIDHYYDNPMASHSLEEIYENLYKLEMKQHFKVENSIVSTFELAESSFPDHEDSYVKNLTFLSLLGYDIFLKKKMMEKIIDQMAEEQNKEKEAVEARKDSKKDQKKDSKKDVKRESKRDTKK